MDHAGLFPRKVGSALPHGPPNDVPHVAAFVRVARAGVCLRAIYDYAPRRRGMYFTALKRPDQGLARRDTLGRANRYKLLCSR
jgi:hypothetical protein